MSNVSSSLHSSVAGCTSIFIPNATSVGYGAPEATGVGSSSFLRHRVFRHPVVIEDRISNLEEILFGNSGKISPCTDACGSHLLRRMHSHSCATSLKTP